MIDEPGGDYWKRWQAFIGEVLLARRLISPPDLALYKITDSVEEAVAEIVGFYRVYHSMRFVGGHLVLRLRHALSEEFLERLRTEFADILTSGTFEQVPALPEEANDKHIATLPRLRFHFNRHSLGRLRLLIDTINRDG
jgi:hypothetical protein